MTNALRSAIYRLRIRKSQATVASTAILEGGEDIVEFLIDGKTVIGPDFPVADVSYWPYPSGGTVTKTIGGFGEPYSVAVSKAKP